MFAHSDVYTHNITTLMEITIKVCKHVYFLSPINTTDTGTTCERNIKVSFQVLNSSIGNGLGWGSLELSRG